MIYSTIVLSNILSNFVILCECTYITDFCAKCLHCCGVNANDKSIDFLIQTKVCILTNSIYSCEIIIWIISCSQIFFILFQIVFVQNCIDNLSYDNSSNEALYPNIFAVIFREKQIDLDRFQRQILIVEQHNALPSPLRRAMWLLFGRAFLVCSCGYVPHLDRLRCFGCLVRQCDWAPHTRHSIRRQNSKHTNIYEIIWWRLVHIVLVFVFTSRYE